MEALSVAAIGDGCRGCFDDALQVTVLETVGSTNTYLSSRFKAGHCVCLAEQQTQARARVAGRQWVAPSGQNILLSLATSFERPLASLSALSLVVALSVCRALCHLGFIDVGVKWPNDIQYRQKKLAGLLLDVIRSSPHGTSVIMGLGLNVNMRADVKTEITQPWTSLSLIRGADLNRNEIVVALLRQLDVDLRLFERVGFEAFQSRWRERDALQGRDVMVRLSSRESVVGVSQGVSSEGFFQLKTAAGVRVFSVGEVSIRPLP